MASIDGIIASTVSTNMSDIVLRSLSRRGQTILVLTFFKGDYCSKVGTLGLRPSSESKEEGKTLSHETPFFV